MGEYPNRPKPKWWTDALPDALPDRSPYRCYYLYVLESMYRTKTKVQAPLGDYYGFNH